MATSGRKRNTGSSDSSKKKWSKRQVSKETFHKWQRTYERELQSMAWLCADIDDQDKAIVSTLWCVVCRKDETRICGLKNFSRAWIDGSSSHKTSNITNHANSEQHKSAMMYLHKDQAKVGMSQLVATAPSLEVFCRRQWIQMWGSESRRSLPSALFLQKNIYPSWNIQQSMNWKRDMEWILA